MSASAVETVRERLDGILGRHSVVLSEELVSGVVDYVSLLPNNETWSQIEEYFAGGPAAEDVADRFAADLAFGTAGLRAEMGIGNARMNILTVGKAATGLSRHLPAPSRILIGYDHRHNSRAFAEISVRIFEGAGHVVDLFPRPVPTPFVPCGMRAACSNDSSGSYYALGIMVTASHNPRQDNGYKVYNERGAQILDSAAAAIAAEISKVTALPPLPPAKATGSAELLERVTDWYNERLGDWLSCLPEPDASLSAPRIVYTPMHGVGGRYVMEVVSRQFPSFELIPVKEQFDPNPDFPTVEYPNPEEGASSLQLAIRAAESHSATFIFANDPDADRFLVAERMSGSSSDGWKIFNGNEIAAILAHFISESRVCTQLSCTQDCTQHHKQQICMLSSCVSSRFLKRLCAHHAFHHETTATGFKNLGNRAWELQQFCSRRPVFAYEEAIGFAVGEWNFDKDGVSALATMLACIRRHGSLLELLQRIYRLYGATPLQCNGYLLVGQPRTAIDRMLAERIPALRRRFPEVTVVAAAEKATELLLPQPDSWLMIRASGTEPKVKYYSEMMLPSGDASDCQESFEKLVQDVVKYLLE